MITSVMLLTPAEARLIKTIKELQYGTIGEFELSECEEKLFEREVSNPQKAMVEELRKGWQHVLLVKVHQGEPNYMEVPTKLNGFDCKKLFKFV